MTLRLIKGGKQQDLSLEVKVKWAQLLCQATYFNKKKESKVLQDLILEYDGDENKEHLLLLEIFKKFEYLNKLGTVPFSFIEQFKALAESMLEEKKQSNG